MENSTRASKKKSLQDSIESVESTNVGPDRRKSDNRIAENKKELANAIKRQKDVAKERKNLDKIKEIKKRVNRIFVDVKEGEKKLQDHEFFTKKQKLATPTKSTPKKKASSSNGKLVNKGIDDSQREPFAEDEQEHLDGVIDKLKEVNKLDYDCIRYLVTQLYLDDLKKIKAGKLKSKVHNDFQIKGPNSRSNLLSQIRTSLFTDNQIDYINGLLQGIFDTTEKDANGDIKHSEIDYVLIVMFTEATIRIVKHVHKFKTNKQAHDFMIKSSDEAFEDSD